MINLQVQDYTGTKPRAIIKTTVTQTKGSDMEQFQEVCRITRSVPNYTCIFLDFVFGFRSYEEKKTMQFGYCFGVYVK